MTPEPTKAKLRGGVRKACKKSWKKTKTIIRGESSEDQMSIVESQRSRKSNTETEEGTEDPPKPPSNPETGSTSNATGDNASRYEAAEDHTDKRDSVRQRMDAMRVALDE